jgi:hypothetical protein
VTFLCSFETVSEAIYFKSFTEKENLVCKLIPTPRKIASSCSYSAVFESEDATALIQELKENDVEYRSMYRCFGDGEWSYEELDAGSVAS